MTTGLSLHIGLNQVDPNHYQGWSGPLTACEADASDMQLLANNRGYTSRILLTATATRQVVTDGITAASRQLQTGDIFFLTYSGHGGQIPDLNGDETKDGQDETWCLFDGQLVDDELYSLLGQFGAGVRILVLSDSCHSGTITKAAYFGNNQVYKSAQGKQVNYRNMPREVAFRTYHANKAMYDPILKNKKIANARSTVSASAILISGCQDNQLSSDGDFNGLFTGTLLRTWTNGAFKGNYQELCKAIVNKMPPDQTPNYFTVGTANPAFENQAVFTI